MSEQIEARSAIESQISYATGHLMGEILTLIDAVVEDNRRGEKTKELVRGFFSNFRDIKWSYFNALKERVQLPDDAVICRKKTGAGGTRNMIEPKTGVIKLNHRN